ncbi:MAG: mRNA-degrading endonuclease [Alphaproteobacteria bacterium]|nr:mRNA-degrading endonuclease [Alphaproteobacteria bacterium]
MARNLGGRAVARKPGNPDRAYQPERGDFALVDFDPRVGTEQSGRRPALILSPRSYNVATGLAFACPLTNQVKGSAFEVALPAGLGVTGVVLANQLRAIDWIERHASFHARAPRTLLDEVLARIEAVLYSVA